MKMLASYRKAIKLTQKEIASEIGVSLSFYAKIESGNKMPSYDFICKFISRFPDVDVNIFFNNNCH